MVNNEYKEAAVEVLGILNELEENEFNKIPNKIIEFLENNKSNTYNPTIDFSGNVNEMQLKDKTREILAGIYLDYLCKEDEKEKIIKNIRKNEFEYQEEIRKQYNADNLFKPKIKDASNKSKEVSMINYKESFFKKLLKKLQKLFSKNK